MNKKELEVAKLVYRVAGEFFKAQRERGYNHKTNEAINLKAALWDLDKVTDFQLSSSKRVPDIQPISINKSFLT